MQIQVTIDYDEETGEYEVGVRNKSHPGVGVEWNALYPVLKQIIGQLDHQIEAEHDTLGSA